jgi:5-(carboxyamino)imidazole ribonucleotide synthase
MVIGIVGGGQLAQMMALAGIPLGMRFIFLEPAADACAASLGEHLVGAYDDTGLLSTMAEKADVVTYEFENVPASAIAFLDGKVDVAPNDRALATARDRFNEKSLFRELEIPTVPFATVDSLDDLRQAVSEFGLPAILKTRTLGYDGKGQAMLRTKSDMDAAWEAMGSMPLILEGFARFHRELSIIAARGRDGEIRFYPLSETHHRDGILHTARNLRDDSRQEQAESYSRRLMENLGYVGVMALELFDTDDGLMANEIAPRVHNSGHWSIEGSITSQFENHLRAIAGLPLGSTVSTGYTTMINFIGTMPARDKVLAVSGVSLHDYGKEPKPGRKIGHATLWSEGELEEIPEFD